MELELGVEVEVGLELGVEVESEVGLAVHWHMGQDPRLCSHGSMQDAWNTWAQACAAMTLVRPCNGSWHIGQLPRPELVAVLELAPCGRRGCAAREGGGMSIWEDDVASRRGDGMSVQEDVVAARGSGGTSLRECVVATRGSGGALARELELKVGMGVEVGLELEVEMGTWLEVKVELRGH